MSAKAFSILTALVLLFAFNATATVRYVDLNSPNATPPYDDWSIAATNIQDAIDAAVDGDLVLVTNGVYATGGRVVAASTTTNRVAITKPLTLQSVNGSDLTIIQGHQVSGTLTGSSAVRCVYLTNGATLVGFTLTNGATKDNYGGGVWCQSSNNTIISNCKILRNAAASSGGGLSRHSPELCFV